MQLIPVEIANKFINRALACHDCESFDKEQKKCNECGCHVKLKIMIPYSTCPLDKWPK